MVEVVAKHGRYHPGGAVGGCRDDLASAGVFFVDRHGIDGQPIGKDVGLRAVGALLVAKLLEERAGPPLYSQPAGELALSREPAIDAAFHRTPERSEPGIDLGVGAGGSLVCQHHLGDGVATLLCHSQHGGGVLERERDLRVRIVAAARLTALEFLGRHDEAAADRIVNLAQVAHPLGVGGMELHAIGMARERRAIVKEDVVMRIEHDRDAARAKAGVCSP